MGAATHDTLITPRGVSPHPAAWTADDLRALLLNRPNNDGHT
jgi:hypothetical protein